MTPDQLKVLDAAIRVLFLDHEAGYVEGFDVLAAHYPEWLNQREPRHLAAAALRDAVARRGFFRSNGSPPLLQARKRAAGKTTKTRPGE